MNEKTGKIKLASSSVTKTRVLWPSKMDMVEKCSASAETEDLDIIIDQVGQEASLGQAIHDIASRIVLGEQVSLDKEGVRSAAVRYGAENNIEDLISLSAAAVSAWSGLKRYFRNPQVEQSSRIENVYTNPHTGEETNVVLSGKHDVYEIFDSGSGAVKKWGVNLDWKSGRKADDASYRSQMLAYAYLILARDQEIEQVITIIVWLRDRNYSVVTFKKEEIIDWFNNFIKRSVFWDGKTYSPGDHCMWCKRFYVCPARVKMVSTAIREFSGLNNMAPAVLNPDGSLVDADKLYMAYSQGQMLKKVLDQFFSQVREEILKRDTVVVRSVAGKKFGFYTKKSKGASYVDPQRAWPILEEVFTEDELANIVDLSASKIHKAAMEKAEAGKKKKFADDLLVRLDLIGAITRSPDVKKIQVGEIAGDDTDANTNESGGQVTGGKGHED